MSRSVQINVRVTEEQFAEWQARATADRRTLSDWIRLAVETVAAKDPKPRSGKR